MDIVRWNQSELKVVGKRCDKCGRDWRSYRSLDQELELAEFTRIKVNAGYNALHFVDGDYLLADLCQCCTSALLGSVLRRVGNQFERELTVAELERADDAWFDLAFPHPNKGPRLQ